MKLYSENENYKLYQGNMLDMLEVIESNTIDSIVTDPPYELNFMGKGWDNAGVSFNADTWKKCFDVLKPGGYLLAFGGSRTFHRIACAIEDAGFEIRDTIMWLYGSGFPKSMALDKSIEGKLTIGSANTKDFKKLNGELLDKTGIGFAKNQFEQGIRPQDYNKNGQQRLGKLEPTTELAKKYTGWGTALKPSFEPIIVARKPFKGSLVDNVIEYGVGGINIDECRVKTNDKDIQRKRLGGYNKEYVNGNNDYEGMNNNPNEAGRFPANTILTYDETDFDEVCGGFPYSKSAIIKPYKNNNTTETSMQHSKYKTGSYFNDSGSASRYFYCAKASKKDRDEGLDLIEEKYPASAEFRPNHMEKALQGEDGNPYGRWQPRKNIHPTVKPTELMQYLVRLVTPNGGTVLDPFNGSGSTGKAVMYENKERNKGYRYIGIELTEEYLPIARARIEYVCNLEEEIKPQTTIFDYIGDSNE